MRKISQSRPHELPPRLLMLLMQFAVDVSCCCKDSTASSLANTRLLRKRYNNILLTDAPASVQARREKKIIFFSSRQQLLKKRLGCSGPHSRFFRRKVTERRADALPDVVVSSDTVKSRHFSRSGQGFWWSDRDFFVSGRCFSRFSHFPVFQNFAFFQKK